VIGGARRRQTLRSFDYQWGALPEGEAMLSDPAFADGVERILADELLGIRRDWFPGRTVLDAGCGGGRWTVGLLRLGCRVLAVDASKNALLATRAAVERLAPEVLDRLETRAVDLLRVPPGLADAPFDLVFSFGVLHHTGDTRAALAQVAPLVRPDGVLFLYLYGTSSTPALKRLVLEAARLALLPLPFPAKRAVLRRLLPGRDTHQAFDLLSPLVNDRLDLGTVDGWLRDEGYTDVARTLDHTELFLRASRQACSAGPFLPPPARPYWFERPR
jgi:SAM-dependent methyltransferase